MLSQLSILFGVNVGRPQNVGVFGYVGKHMKFDFIPLSVEISSIDACFGYNWMLFFPSQEFCF